MLASPSLGKAISHFSHCDFISSTSVSSRPHGINEALILIKQPTLSESFILHSIQQYPTHTLSWLPQVFNCNQRTEGFADEDVFHINQLTIGSH